MTESTNKWVVICKATGVLIDSYPTRKLARQAAKEGECVSRNFTLPWDVSRRSLNLPITIIHKDNSKTLLNTKDEVVKWFQEQEGRIEDLISGGTECIESLDAKLNAIAVAAKDLYLAGRWRCGRSPASEKRLWDNLLDAAGLESLVPPVYPTFNVVTVLLHQLKKKIECNMPSLWPWNRKARNALQRVLKEIEDIERTYE
jgi:hypothetical protein